MAAVNKQSLREEFEALKTRFEPLCAEGKMSTMPGALQYGPGLKAYVVHLLVAQMLSLKRVAQSVQTLIGQTISEATLLNYILLLHHALADWERRTIEQLLAMPAMHVDETSLRVERKNYWIHVYCAGELTLKCLHAKRCCEAIDAIGIIPRYGGGAVVHDCWTSYLSYAQCEHGLCGSHLLRELTFIVDAHGYAWARLMKGLLQDTCHRVSQRKDRTHPHLTHFGTPLDVGQGHRTVRRNGHASRGSWSVLVIAFSTTWPFSLTTRDVPLRAATSRARRPARTRAAGAACMSSSGSRETGTADSGVLMSFLLLAAVMVSRRRCRTPASSRRG